MKMNQRGDIAIFTSLLVVTIMLSGAIALGIILSQQIPVTLELQNSEQAFYGALSGTEHAFFELIHNGATEVLIEPGDEIIPYNDAEDVQYFGEFVLLRDCPAEGDPDYRPSCRDNTLCGAMSGSVNGVRRRLARGVPELECEHTLSVGD